MGAGPQLNSCLSVGQITSSVGRKIQKAANGTSDLESITGNMHVGYRKFLCDMFLCCSKHMPNNASYTRMRVHELKSVLILLRTAPTNSAELQM
jgi:hypothetical protein